MMPTSSRVSTFDPLRFPNKVDLMAVVPYRCVVNADQNVIYGKDFRDCLQPCPEELRINEATSVKEFISRLDPTKQLWRPIQTVDERTPFMKMILLDTKSQFTMTNTGQGDLLVGELIYIFPAMPHLANNNASVNIFEVDGKPYVHPMVVGKQERERLIQDLITIELSRQQGMNEREQQSFNIKTLIGHMLNKYADDDDITLISMYIRSQDPTASILHHWDQTRALSETPRPSVSLGGRMACISVF